MVRVFVTGSIEGLGRGAAEQLIAGGHEVIVHARNNARAAEAPLGARDIVIGDLSTAQGVADVAQQLIALGPVDSVIHNAGVYTGQNRAETGEGHPTIFAVNVLAPYLLSAWLPRPKRIVTISSSMQAGGRESLDDLDWQKRRWNGDAVYSESKLLVTTLMLALSRRWPETLVNIVNPGWVPTRMGGTYASDDLEAGHQTQAWLATSDDPAAQTTGGYWYHKQPQRLSRTVTDEAFQDLLLEHLAHVTGVTIA